MHVSPAAGGRWHVRWREGAKRRHELLDDHEAATARAQEVRDEAAAIRKQYARPRHDTDQTDDRSST